MADLSITASAVLQSSGPRDADQEAGEAFAAGALVYKTADGKWNKAQADGTAIQAGSLGVGMALATADVAGARVSIARPGAVVTIAASGLTVGVPYFVSATAGGLAPYADLASGNAVTFAGLTMSATAIKLGYCYDAGAVLA